MFTEHTSAKEFAKDERMKGTSCQSRDPLISRDESVWHKDEKQVTSQTTRRNMNIGSANEDITFTPEPEEKPYVTRIGT